MQYATTDSTSLNSDRAGRPSVTKRYSSVDSALVSEILLQDSLLFAAFNRRDMQTFRSYFEPGLEFYQDTQGLRNFEQCMAAFEGLFQQSQPLHRTLDPIATEVYVIKDYGAMQLGSHRFCHQEAGHDDCGTFRFVHVWHKADGRWRISRILSYDH